jgi:hypothetical protein
MQGPVSQNGEWLGDHIRLTIKTLNPWQLPYYPNLFVFWIDRQATPH